VLIVIIEAIRNRPLSMELKERAFQVAALLFIVLFIAMVVLDLLFPIV
jgi:membrane-associated protease RseP (regulator of RpoE activity)